MMWSKPVAPDVDEVFEFEPPCLTVEMSDNDIIGVLLGPDGEPMRFMLEREPIGYRLR